MSSPSTPIKMERRKALDWFGIALLKWLCIGVLIDFMGFPIALAAKAAFNGQGLSFHLVQDTAAYLIIALRLDDDIAIVSDTIGAIAGIVSYGLIVAKIPERKGFEFAKLRRRHIPGALGTAIVGIAISAAMSGNPVFVLHAYLSWIKTIRIATPYGLLSTSELVAIVAIPFIGTLIDGYLRNPYDFTAYLPGATSRFAKRKDIASWGIYHTGTRGAKQGYMGVLGKCPFTRLYLMMPETLGALCAAPPGTGKTTSLAVPTLLICTENPEDGTPISIIAHDPKVEDRMTRAGRVGELALLTSGYRSKFSDCYNLNFSAQDDKTASVHYPSWNFMSPLVVPPVGGQRDNYIDRMTAIICPESTSSADPFWTRAARGALAGFIHFMISKVERANLQDRIHEILSKPDYSEDQTARIPFPPHIKAEILGLMTRVDYAGPLRQYLEQFGGLSQQDGEFHEIGTWDGLPSHWTPRGRAGVIEPSMAMLTDYLAYSIAAFANPTTNSDLENPVFGAPKQTKDGEAEAYWRMVNECGKYGYPTRARNELTSIANLAPQTRTSITKQLDTNTNIFQNPAVAERTSSTDITFSDIRGRWDRTANGGQGGFRGATVYISVPTTDAVRMGPLTALLIESLSNWLISAKPNNADALRRYFVAKDRLDDLIARNANTASIMAQSEIVAKLKRVLNLDELGNPIGPCHTLFLIDEFPILPKINALLIGPEVGRGMKVSYYLICQNFPQIAEKYGQDAVNRMISNSYALVVLPVSDDSTAERIAKLAGHTTSIKESYSRSMDFKSWMNGGNKSLSAEKISLIEPTHLRSMSGTYGADRYILFIRDRHDHPAIVDSAKWFADPRLKTLVNPSVLEHNRGLPEEEWTGGYRETTAMPIHAMAMHKIRMGLYDRKYFTAEETPTLPPFALALIESREAHNRRLAEGATAVQAA